MILILQLQFDSPALWQIYLSDMAFNKHLLFLLTVIVLFVGWLLVLDTKQSGGIDDEKGPSTPEPTGDSDELKCPNPPARPRPAAPKPPGADSNWTPGDTWGIGSDGRKFLKPKIPPLKSKGSKGGSKGKKN